MFFLKTPLAHITNFALIALCLLASGSLFSQSDLDCCCGEPEEIEVPGGDFEFDPYPAPGGWIDYTSSFGPWDVSTGSVSHHDDGHNNLGAGNPNPSTAHLDLNGFSTGGICQDVSGFEVGQECTIVFFYAIHNGISQGSADLEIGGGSVLSVSWDATNVGSSEWLEASYDFIPNDETLDVCFTSQTFVGCCGMLLDDIVIFCCQADQEDPSFVDEPNDLFFQCLDDVPEENELEAEDDCSDDLIIEFEEDLFENDCVYTFERVWTVEDECGNTYAYQQIIEVYDDEDPELVSSPLDLVISCSDDLEESIDLWIENFGNATVVDNCEEVLVEAVYNELPEDGCFEEEVIFSFFDECGNSESESAYIVFEDDDEPEFLILPQNLNINCGENADSLLQLWLLANGESEISDICEIEVTNDFDGVIDTSEWVNFIAVDLCGNVAIEGALITVNSDIDTLYIAGASCNPLDTGYVETFISGAGPCDSLIIQDISFLKSDTSYLQEFVCDLPSMEHDTMVLLNQVGCDSIIYLTRIPSRSDTVEITTPTCDPDLITSDTTVLLNMFQCDSLIVENFYLTENDTIVNISYDCNLLEDSISYSTVPGQICDTIIVDQILVAKNDTINIVEYECDIDQIVIAITEVPGPICDSVFIVETIPLESNMTFISKETCRLDEVRFDTLHFTNLAGCDSIVIEEFLYAPLPAIMDSMYDCNLLDPVFDTLYVTGVCDSIFITKRIPATESQYIEINTTCRLEEVGMDTTILTNEKGCDSLFIQDFVYDPLDPVYSSKNTCIKEEEGLDTILVFGAHCDSIIIVETILLPPETTQLIDKVCDSNNLEPDTLWLSSIEGCDSIVITNYELLPVNFEYETDVDPCSEDHSGIIIFQNETGGNPPYVYSIDGIQFESSDYYNELAPGSYSLSAMDSDGCISEEIEIEIPHFDVIDSNLDGVYEIEQGSSISFDIQFSQQPDTFYWSQPEILDCNYCNLVSITPSVSTHLTLFMVSEFGCVTTDDVEIRVKASSIYIPNIFSPDQNQVNDEFRIFNNGYVDRYKSFRIYDRWGNVVFELSDVDGAEVISWNGTFNDTPLNPDVFVYQMILETKSGKEEQWTGSITLIR